MKKHIPNFVTCCNLFSGCVATAFAFAGDAKLALLCIIIGAVFDFFDGMTARLLRVSSPIGKELDSLADDITFGLAPSAILFSQLQVMDYPQFLEPLRSCLPSVAFVMAAFSALRLAKFNLDERQALGFIGLPTPANALFWGSLIVGLGDRLEVCPWAVLLVLMFALKFKHWGWKGNEVKYIFLATCVPLLVVFGISSFAIIIAWYVILSAIVKPSSVQQ